MLKPSVTAVAVNLNGISIAYIMAVPNALFAVLIAFGMHITPEQAAALDGLLNAMLVLTIHVAHRVGEACSSGASTQASQERTPQTESSPP